MFKVEYKFEVDAMPKACEAEVIATSKPDRTIVIYMPRLGELSRAVKAVFPPEDVVLDAIIHETFEQFTMLAGKYPHRELIDHLYRQWRERYWQKRKNQ